MDANTKKYITFLVIPLLLLNVLAITAYAQVKPDFILHVNFYDVGQGDAIFIQTYQGNQILIDGGPSSAVLSKLGEDLPFFDRTIDMVILTHAHADHVAGLVEVIKRYEVKKVILPEVGFHSGTYDKFLELIEEKNIEKIYAKEGMRVYFDNGTAFDIFYPSGKVLGIHFEDGFSSVGSSELNDTSVVGKLTFGESKILFTGDAGINIEKQILTKYNLDVDLLKVGHHGSRFSSSEDLLAEATPDIAVIEVGKNSYGHPTEEVLQRLSEHKVKVFRTDRDRTIKFVSDGVNIYKQ